MLGLESKLYKKEKRSSSSILKTFRFFSAKGWYKYPKYMRACSSYYIQTDLKFSVSQRYAYFLCFSMNSFYSFPNLIFLAPCRHMELLTLHFWGTEAAYFWSLPLWLNLTTVLLFSKNLCSIVMSFLMSSEISPISVCSLRKAGPALPVNIFPWDTEGTHGASQSYLKRITIFSMFEVPTSDLFWLHYKNVFSLNSW